MFRLEREERGRETSGMKKRQRARGRRERERGDEEIIDSFKHTVKERERESEREKRRGTESIPD